MTAALVLVIALCVSAALVTFGVALMCVPAAFIVGGILLAVVALFTTRGADVVTSEDGE